MVTSLFSSIFTSSQTSLKNRIQSIKDAEEILLEYATNMTTEHEVTIKLIDTIIPKSSIPCLEDSKCLLMGLNNPNHIDKHTTDKQDDDELVIHGIHAESKSQLNKEIPLVLLHGYANGALYFYRNVQHLSHYFSQIYAIDMLGWGLSSRPAYNFSSKSVTEVEEFYIESIEAFRKQHNLQKMILGGHSLGGYIAVAYSEKYPQHVEKLVLLSPVGVPSKSKEEEKMDIQKIKASPWSFRMLASTAMTFWANGITPGSFIRAFPERKGWGLVQSYIHKRLPNISDEKEQNALVDYLYHTAKLPGSGEYCLNKLLKPMAHAYKPLLPRIPKLKLKDITFLYGEKDWMDPQGGLDVIDLCESMRGNGVHTPNVTLDVVEGAGHLLMLENWAGFNRALIRAVTGGETSFVDEKIVQKSEVVKNVDESVSTPTSVIPSS